MSAVSTGLQPLDLPNYHRAFAAFKSHLPAEQQRVDGLGLEDGKLQLSLNHRCYWWFCWDKWEKICVHLDHLPTIQLGKHRQAVAVACCFVVSSGFFYRWPSTKNEASGLYAFGRERLMLLQRLRPNGGPNICSWC